MQGSWFRGGPGRLSPPVSPTPLPSLHPLRASPSPTEHANLFFLLQVFTEALGQMMQTVMYALILLLLLMFVFAILGHGWCEDLKTRDTGNGDSLKALHSLQLNNCKYSSFFQSISAKRQTADFGVLLKKPFNQSVTALGKA